MVIRVGCITRDVSYPNGEQDPAYVTNPVYFALTDGSRNRSRLTVEHKHGYMPPGSLDTGAWGNGSCRPAEAGFP